jgi:hypothetical protein
MQAYLIYALINRRFLLPKHVAAVVTATTTKEAAAFFKAKVADEHKVKIESIRIQKILTKEGMTPEQLIQAWDAAAYEARP